MKNRYSVHERSRKFTDMTTAIESYPVSELFNRDGQTGLLDIGKTKFYEALKQLRIEPFAVGREKHISPQQKDLVEVWLSKAPDEQKAMVAELYGGELAIAPSQPASMVVQPEWGELATRMLEKLQYKEPENIELVRSLGQRLELLSAIAEHNQQHPDRPRTLPTGELALLMDVPKTTISGKQTYRRYGFTCTNLNFRGGRSEWKIE